MKCVPLHLSSPCAHSPQEDKDSQIEHNSVPLFLMKILFKTTKHTYYMKAAKFDD